MPIMLTYRPYESYLNFHLLSTLDDGHNFNSIRSGKIVLAHLIRAKTGGQKDRER